MTEYRLKREGYWDHYKAGKKIDYGHLQIAISQLMRMHIEDRHKKKPVEFFMPNIYDPQTIITIEERKEQHKNALERARRIKPKRK